MPATKGPTHLRPQRVTKVSVMLPRHASCHKLVDGRVSHTGCDKLLLMPPHTHRPWVTTDRYACLPQAIGLAVISQGRLDVLVLGPAWAILQSTHTRALLVCEQE